MPLVLDINKGSEALFSKDRKYRYYLTRRFEWLFGANDSSLCFVMLNPSTADAFRNDPTLERCERRARHLGFGRFEVLNLFGLRSTNPEMLKKVEDPIGEDWLKAFEAFLEQAKKRQTQVVVAWGNDGELGGRDRAVLDLLRAHFDELWCLGVNQTGTPKHPLYVAYEEDLRLFEPTEVSA